jgi:hypothetical protein
MESHTANTPAEQRHGRRADAFATLDDLGEYIQKINALLRAAGNTGADEREDEAWLVSLAWDAAVEMKKRYMEWAVGPAGAAGEPEFGV